MDKVPFPCGGELRPVTLVAYLVGDVPVGIDDHCDSVTCVVFELIDGGVVVDVVDVAVCVDLALLVELIDRVKGLGVDTCVTGFVELFDVLELFILVVEADVVASLIFMVVGILVDIMDNSVGSVDLDVNSNVDVRVDASKVEVGRLILVVVFILCSVEEGNVFGDGVRIVVEMISEQFLP